MAERRGTKEVPADALVQVHQRFRPPLAAYFFRRSQDQRTADELTEEVFIRLASNPAFGFGETPEIHVFRIASEVLQDWNRHCAARASAATSKLATTIADANPEVIALDERARSLSLAAKQALLDLERALSGLPRKTREIFVLARVENVPGEQIARLYKTSEIVVKKHVLKAIAHLSARAFKP